VNKQFPKIVLSGATGGIGESIAVALDQEGYALLVTGRSEEKLKRLLYKLKGEQHQYVVADLITSEGIAALKAAANDFGANGVINCLGINELATLDDIAGEAISQMLSTNLLAPINICQALIPLLEEQREGVIINVGSVLGSIGYAGSSVYCASKFGLRGFTESLRRELSDSNISVIYLAPRATNTELNTDAMNKMNQELGNALDEPVIVAKQILKALGEGKSVNRYLGWPESFFVRLNSLFPSVVDKALAKQLPTIRRYCGENKAVKNSI